jgi:hypothetical protein
LKVWYLWIDPLWIRSRETGQIEKEGNADGGKSKHYPCHNWATISKDSVDALNLGRDYSKSSTRLEQAPKDYSSITASTISGDLAYPLPYRSWTCQEILN